MSAGELCENGGERLLVVAGALALSGSASARFALSMGRLGPCARRPDEVAVLVARKIDRDHHKKWMRSSEASTDARDLVKKPPAGVARSVQAMRDRRAAKNDGLAGGWWLVPCALRSRVKDLPSACKRAGKRKRGRISESAFQGRGSISEKERSRRPEKQPKWFTPHGGAASLALQERVGLTADRVRRLQSGRGYACAARTAARSSTAFRPGRRRSRMVGLAGLVDGAIARERVNESWLRAAGRTCAHDRLRTCCADWPTMGYRESLPSDRREFASVE